MQLERGASGLEAASKQRVRRKHWLKAADFSKSTTDALDSSALYFAERSIIDDETAEKQGPIYQIDSKRNHP